MRPVVIKPDASFPMLICHQWLAILEVRLEVRFLLQNVLVDLTLTK